MFIRYFVSFCSGTLADQGQLAAGLVALGVGDQVEVEAGGGAVARIVGEGPDDGARGRLQGGHMAGGDGKEFNGRSGVNVSL